MSTYCNIKKEFCSKNSTQAILQSNNTSLIISLMFISPWIALVLFKPFHVVLKCIFFHAAHFWRQSSAKEFLSQMVLEMLEKNPNIFFQWPKFFHVCWKNVIDFEHSWFRCMGMWAHYMAVRSFYPGASRSRESLRVLSMGSRQNTYEWASQEQISQSTIGVLATERSEWQ